MNKNTRIVMSREYRRFVHSFRSASASVAICSSQKLKYFALYEIQYKLKTGQTVNWSSEKAMYTVLNDFSRTVCIRASKR
jgi:hypothetical protein